MTAAELGLDLSRYKLGWSDEVDYVYKPKRGLDEEIIKEISWMKGEPQWMRDFRLKSYRHFLKRPMPNWGGDMSEIFFDDIFYYIKPTEKQVDVWDELPESVKNTYEKLGIPEAERKYLAGVTAQYECLRGSTKVWTSRGMRSIKELGAGDEVFSLDEDTKQIVPARVVGAACSGEKPVFEIRARGRIIGASGNHPFLVLRDERRNGAKKARYITRWVPAEELNVGDLVAIATDLPDSGESAPLMRPSGRDGARLPSQSNVDLCWFAGVFVGDGYLHHRGEYTSVEIAVDRTDETLISEICRVASEQFALEFALAPDGLRLVARGTAALAEFLELNGLAGTAHTKRVPDWLYATPRSERLAYLAGYLDADGYVRDHPTAKDAMYHSVNRALLEDVRDLLALSGIGSSSVIEVIQPSGFDPTRVQTSYHLRLSGRFDRLPCRSPRRSTRLGARNYHHTYRTAKGTVFRTHTSDMLGFVKIERIDPVGVEAVYDIEVEGHHNFVAEGFVVHNSEVVFHRNREDLAQLGVIFTDMDTALREHPEIVKAYFGRVIPPNDNKFSSLNSSVWSGGSFIYVPPGVKVPMPLQAYFRINAENMGQFERTLIIADEGSEVHYIEGCSAPVYTTDSLHSAVVEIVVKPSARVTYTTIQNWSNNVFNLVTKRARVETEGHMEWIDGNIGCVAQGSRVTTPSGVKPIELVMPGDQVLSYDETAGELVWRTVTARKFSGHQPVREVRAGERRIHVTDNHPFYSFTYDAARARKLGRYALAYVRADQMSSAIVPRTSLDYGEPYKLELPDTVTDFTTANQYADGLPATRSRASRLEVSRTTTDDLMWLFGLFVGDGSIDVKPAANGGARWAKVTFATPRSDRARARLCDVMARLMPGVTPTDRRDGIAVTWSSVELASLFTGNGFVTGATRKRVPSWVFDVPESQRTEFVAGLLDSDGCATDGPGFSIKSVSRDLLGDVAALLVTLGIPSRITTEQDGEREVQILGYSSVCRGAHRIDLPADQRLVDVVSDGLRDAVTKKAVRVLRHHRRVGRSNIELPETVEIRKVEVGEPLVTVPTWDIEVEGTGNFVCEGFIVHNSRLTMKYPAVVMVGPKASGEVLSVAYAGQGQHQDAGAKMTHAAPETTSKIVSKSISKDGGRTSYRGLVRVEADAYGCKSHVQCDALILDENSVSDTYPYMEVGAKDAVIGHEATVSKVADDQLFYLMSRGLSQEQAMGMIVNGFIEPVTRTLPMEYAVEWSRLIELQMEGSVG
jgi:Fe-S cluster assembly scaffold protein SufB